MPLLACKEYVRPILSRLKNAPNGVMGSVLADQVAELTNLADDASLTIADGTPRYLVRIKQARYWLKTQGYVASLQDGRWVITQAGATFLRDTGGAPASLSQAPKKAVDRRKREPRPSSASVTIPDPGEAPLEVIDAALSQITEAVRTELLQRLVQLSPGFFERMVLELLRAMGYAGNLGTVHHTGGPHDGGVDGILHMDRLGLERVYVQAKRWTTSVGAPELQQFCGALSVHHAQKGVILTTSTFTDAARDCVHRVPQTIRMVDGRELAELMIEFAVGVSRKRRLVIPEIDQGFFVEG